MEKGLVEVQSVLVPDHQPTEALEPGISPLHDPAMPIAPQLAAILPASPPIPQMRHDEVNAPLVEPLPEGAAVVAPIRDQPLGLHPRSARAGARDRDVGERAFGEPDLGHRGSFQANSERYTRALDQYQ